MKDFINDFYTYDFTRIIHNGDRSDESDAEIDLELYKEELEASAPVIDHEVIKIITSRRGEYY